jgi:CRISPR-associated protein (TIGR03985 family)
MSEKFFSDRPSVELLQWLARGSLKQNLLRSIRLWACLRFLYENDRNRLWLNDPFTFADWRDTFFSPTHPRGDAIPALHDLDCACARTTAEWLFDAKTELPASEWRQSLQQHDAIPEATLDKLLQYRLFAVTRRSLCADLQILTELSWLKHQGQKYYRVADLPNRPTSRSLELGSTRLSDYGLNFLKPDLATIAHSLSQPIGGVRRFFLEVDYVVPHTALDRVDDWQDKLKSLWEQNPVPTVQLTYNSAKLGASVKCIVYPVCIYYAQRAVYLCAFGQTPTKQGNWYNYRLDRIQKMSDLEWTNPDIPQLLLQRFEQGTLHSSDYIEVQMAEAWGFDFYLTPKPMLLRFDREFHDRYIQGTFRHETFEHVSYQQAKQLIRQHTQQQQHQQALLTVLNSRSPQDAYYYAYYRENDTNVKQRLRAWRPKGEVLLPWELRQSIAEEVEIEFQLYRN